MRFAPLAPLVLAAALTAGCTGADPAAPQLPITPAAAAPSTLGTPVTVADARASTKATAYAYRQPLRSSAKPRRRGYAFAGVDARVCVLQVDGTNRLPVSWAPWSLEFADDTVAGPVGGWSDESFSVQLFPGTGFDRQVREGRCVRGWILFEVPKGKRPVRVVYAPRISPKPPAPADWSLT
jgi:hypothetical protein